jgi:hypothetical protein
MGGALGVGLVGAVFNVVAGPALVRLRAMGLRPGVLLDPTMARGISPELLREVQQAFSGGLIWVFAAMVALAAALFAISRLLPMHKVDHTIPAAEAVEALAGAP